MNNEEDKKLDVEDAEKVKDISKLAGRYAENRTLPFVVGMVQCLLIAFCFGLPSRFGGKAYRDGNMVLFWICMFFIGCDVLALFILCFTPWVKKFDKLIVRRLYQEEGEVVFARGEKTKKQQVIGIIGGAIFGGCILLHIALGVHYNLPIKYMQPISALYIIPFIILLGIWQPPTINPAGFLSWLWPVLYGVHAILIVAGVPIVFERPWTGLNMLIPLAGYGLLCALAGHFYSRYALRKLKAAAKLQEDNNE